MMKFKKSILCMIVLTIAALIYVPMPINVQASAASTEKVTVEADTVESAYEEWGSSKTYVSGNIVSYHGQDYEAKWWTSGEEPGAADVWKLISVTDGIDTEWIISKVYVGGDRVTYNNKSYQAKWWTQGETPGAAIVWEEVVTTDPSDPEDPSNPEDPSDPTDPVSDEFKVIGYYPSWSPTKINSIQYNNLTHINYAFAIPTSDGTLLPLENAESAVQIIEKAHQNGVKVLLAVGGWSYNDVPLESTFMSATETTQEIQKFGDAIVSMAKQYGFDGVDIDWEHPRADGTSKQQYEDLMVYLSSQLKENDMLLSAAVLSGVTPDGVVYWDSQAQTDKVIKAVDWFNVMAYDGGDGIRHSTYEFSVMSAQYWKNSRKMPADKVVLGVPFYGRPSWASYADILVANPNAYNTDVSMINGMQAYYNGIPTITAKTQWACENVGGIMIWELSQDTTDLDKSLLNAIGNTVRKNFN